MAHSTTPLLLYPNLIWGSCSINSHLHLSFLLINFTFFGKRSFALPARFLAFYMRLLILQMPRHPVLHLHPADRHFQITGVKPVRWKIINTYNVIAKVTTYNFPSCICKSPKFSSGSSISRKPSPLPDLPLPSLLQLQLFLLSQPWFLYPMAALPIHLVLLLYKYLVSIWARFLT